MTSDEYQYSDFYIVVNDEQLCTALGDPNSGLVNPGTQASCSAVVHLNEGNLLKQDQKSYFAEPVGIDCALLILLSMSVGLFTRRDCSFKSNRSLTV